MNCLKLLLQTTFQPYHTLGGEVAEEIALSSSLGGLQMLEFFFFLYTYIHSKHFFANRFSKEIFLWALILGPIKIGIIHEITFK